MKRNRLFAPVHLDKTRIKRPGRHAKKPNKKYDRKKYKGQGREH